MSEQTINVGDVASLRDVVAPEVTTEALAVVPEPTAEEIAAAEAERRLPADVDAFAGFTFAAGQRLNKSIYVVHGYLVDVPDIDPETNEVKRDSNGREQTVQAERSFDRDYYVTDIGVGERGNLVLAAGEPVTDELVAAITAAEQ